MEARLPERTSGVRLGRRLALAVAAVLASPAEPAAARARPGRSPLAILARYQKVTGSKPLTAGGMIRLRLAAAGGTRGQRVRGNPVGAQSLPGVGRLGGLDRRPRDRARERPTSPTRTASPGSSRTRFCGADHPVVLLASGLALPRIGRAPGSALGSANDEEVSIRLQPYGGNPLLLTFSRRDGRLALGPLPAVRPRLLVRHEVSRRIRSPPSVRRRDRLDRAPHRLDARMPTVGGGRARFSEVSSRDPVRSGVRARRRSRADRRRAGAPGRRRRGGRAGRGSRPVACAAAASRSRRDVFGRRVAEAPRSRSGASTYPSLFVEAARAISRRASTRRRAAASFGRPSWSSTRARASSASTTPSAGSFRTATLRVVIDDDGDRPVAVLDRGSHEAARHRGKRHRSAASLELAPPRAPGGRVCERGRRPADMLWGPPRSPSCGCASADRRVLPGLGRRRADGLSAAAPLPRVPEHAAALGLPAA